MTYRLFWGDLHSHCSISYGHGTVEQALARARQQLDFCSVTGHAFWPDMPTDRAQYTLMCNERGGTVDDCRRAGKERPEPEEPKVPVMERCEGAGGNRRRVRLVR